MERLTRTIAWRRATTSSSSVMVAAPVWSQEVHMSQPFQNIYRPIAFSSMLYRGEMCLSKNTDKGLRRKQQNLQQRVSGRV